MLSTGANLFLTFYALPCGEVLNIVFICTLQVGTKNKLERLTLRQGSGDEK